MDRTHPIYDSFRPEDESVEDKYWSETETSTDGRKTGLPGDAQRTIHPLQDLLCRHNLRVRIISFCEKPKYARCNYDDTALADFLIAKRLLGERGYKVIRISDEAPEVDAQRNV